MTGYSWNRKYNKKMVSCLLFIGGAFLLVEHVYNFDGMDFEIIGHEILGIGMIITGFILSLKWKQIPALLKAIKEHRWHAVIDEGERNT